MCDTPYPQLGRADGFAAPRIRGATIARRLRRAHLKAAGQLEYVRHHQARDNRGGRLPPLRTNRRKYYSRGQRSRSVAKRAVRGARGHCAAAIDDEKSLRLNVAGRLAAVSERSAQSAANRASKRRARYFSVQAANRSAHRPIQ